MAALSLVSVVTEHFPVDGMTCGACARRIAAALPAVPGVHAVRVDLATGRATVRHDPQQSPAAVLQRAVAATGYTLYAPVSSVRTHDWLRLLIAELLAAGALLALYLGVITLVQDWGHALGQLIAEGPFVGALTLGFGTQVGLWVYLRSRNARTPAVGVAASTGTSGVAMLACCAHHLAEVLPILGLSGAALFLAEVQLPLLWLGLSMNLAGILYLLRQIRRQRRWIAQPLLCWRIIMSKHRGAAAVVRGAHSTPVHQTHRLGTRRTRRWAWWWVPLELLLFLAGGGLAVILSGGLPPAPGGTLAAARTQYDFGQVPINGGGITTQFPLTVNGDALVTDITTT